MEGPYILDRYYSVAREHDHSCLMHSNYTSWNIQLDLFTYIRCEALATQNSAPGTTVVHMAGWNFITNLNKRIREANAKSGY
jgi:hypothetical protein